jgi:hypothetical protein
MLQKSLSYKSILRIVGIVLLLYGLYWVIRDFTAQVVVVGDQQYSGALIFWDPGEVWTTIFYGDGFLFAPGPLFYVGIGLFLLALTTRRIIIAYVSLQVALWLVSMSFWIRSALFLNPRYVDVPASFTPFFWATLALSLVLLAAYKPITHLMLKLFGTPLETGPRVHI